MAQARELPQQNPLTTGFDSGADADATQRATVQYQMAVRTGDVPGAGTDGTVWLWVDGSTGVRTEWLYLDNSDNNFERNQTDYFYFQFQDLGTPVSAWVNFQKTGTSTDWFLNTVSVNGRVFSFYKWMPDGQTVQGN